MLSYCWITWKQKKWLFMCQHHEDHMYSDYLLSISNMAHNQTFLPNSASDGICFHTIVSLSGNINWCFKNGYQVIFGLMSMIFRFKVTIVETRPYWVRSLFLVTSKNGISSMSQRILFEVLSRSNHTNTILRSVFNDVTRKSLCFRSSITVWC